MKISDIEEVELVEVPKYSFQLPDNRFSYWYCCKDKSL
jgi:hypothetical protein